MKLKTSELTGATLDWAVAKCEGITEFDRMGQAWVPMRNEPHFNEAFSPSTNWSQGGPIIEREKIALDYDHDVWNAAAYSLSWYVGGPTPLIAAMRCFVVSKLGDEIDVPEELT